jgi:hypothetical protein
MNQDGPKEAGMFEELDQQIRRDDEAVTTRAQRRIKNAVVILVSVVLFGGLYAALRFMES